MNKILVVGLGGTIGSVANQSISLDSNNLKILDYCKRDDVVFEGVSPFSVLSENMNIRLWKKLLEFIAGIDFNDYAGVIILHGSDTLAYTSALVANAFPDKNIVLVAADKPVEDSASNAILNFNNAVNLIISGTNGVFVSYDKIHKADCITSADCNDKFVSIAQTLSPIGTCRIYDKNILIIHPYVNMDFNNYNISSVDCVLIAMYHSATVPDSAKDFCRDLKAQGIPYYFVTHKNSADYETAKDLDNIIFNCTVENAYARELLTN